jgi:hypothetical protein
MGIEAEVRQILRNAIRDDPQTETPLGTRIRARFARIGLDEGLPELRCGSTHSDAEVF